MRSTRQLLTTPFVKGDSPNEERLKKIEEVSQLTIEVPEIYMDKIHMRIMDKPYNIQLPTKTPSAPYHIDEHTLAALRRDGNRHPLSRDEISPDYKMDEDLAGRIETFITIEEIKIYLTKTEQRRQINLLEVLTGKSDDETNALLAFHSIEIMQASRYPIHAAPKHFFSHAPCIALMTLPVMLDGTFTIDFHELLQHQPAPQLTINQHTDGLERELEREKERRKEIAKMDHQRNIRSLKNSAWDGGAAEIEKCEAILAKKLETIDQLTIADVSEAEVNEYINPCTGRPIQSIVIHITLLEEIDTFLDPMLHQINLVEKHIAKLRHPNKRYHKGLPAEKSYAEMLKNENYPAEKIPESLALGLIPGQAQLEIMTHPVLLDGLFLMDYQRLQEFWTPPASGFFSFFQRAVNRHGINPFTNQKIQTITYDQQLKVDTDNFMLNREVLMPYITPDQAQNGSYRRSTFKNQLHQHEFRMYIFHPPRANPPALSVQTDTEKNSVRDLQ